MFVTIVLRENRFLVTSPTSVQDSNKNCSLHRTYLAISKATAFVTFFNLVRSTI